MAVIAFSNFSKVLTPLGDITDKSLLLEHLNESIQQQYSGVNILAAVNDSFDQLTGPNSKQFGFKTLIVIVGGRQIANLDIGAFI